MLEAFLMGRRITQRQRASAAGARTVTGSPSGNLAPAVAGDALLSTGLLPLRNALGTHRRRLRATGAVNAAAGGRQRGWRLARAYPREPCGLDVGVRDRNRREQLVGVGVAGRSEQRC